VKYNTYGVQSGRLSSSHPNKANGPNIQNIPIRTELGRRIRDAFVCDEKQELIDYGEIERRILEQMEGKWE